MVAIFFRWVGNKTQPNHQPVSWLPRLRVSSPRSSPRKPKRKWRWKRPWRLPGRPGGFGTDVYAPISWNWAVKKRGLWLVGFSYFGWQTTQSYIGKKIGYWKVRVFFVAQLFRGFVGDDQVPSLRLCPMFRKVFLHNIRWDMRWSSRRVGGGTPKTIWWVITWMCFFRWFFQGNPSYPPQSYPPKK